MLKFTCSSKFYGRKVWEFNLPAGHSCPFAMECRASADEETGKITNGQYQKFRCYAATAERFPAVRGVRWKNFRELEEMKTSREMAQAICRALPIKATHVRIHGGGDFFSKMYFDAWLDVCRMNPSVKFWAFTKSILSWIIRRDVIPPNLTINASLGGELDFLVHHHKLKFAKVFRTREEAEASGLPID